MYQLVFDRDKNELVLNRLFFAKVVHFFEIATVFICIFVIDQNVRIFDVSQKVYVDVEFITHLQQINIAK